jgi:hypothetical protein
MIERDLIRACHRDRVVEALAPRGACLTKPSLKVGIVLKAPRWSVDLTISDVWGARAFTSAFNRCRDWL